MKNYTITVNGNVYDVVVEEGASTGAPVAKAPAAPKASGSAGAVAIKAPMPGNILKMNVKVGDTVPANGLVCILEAMKMENEIFCEKGGVVASIDAPVGTAVQSGDVIITLN